MQVHKKGWELELENRLIVTINVNKPSQGVSAGDGGGPCPQGCWRFCCMQ